MRLNKVSLKDRCAMRVSMFFVFWRWIQYMRENDFFRPSVSDEQRCSHLVRNWAYWTSLKCSKSLKSSVVKFFNLFIVESAWQCMEQLNISLSEKLETALLHNSNVHNMSSSHLHISCKDSIRLCRRDRTHLSLRQRDSIRHRHMESNCLRPSHHRCLHHCSLTGILSISDFLK